LHNPVYTTQTHTHTHTHTHNPHKTHTNPTPTGARVTAVRELVKNLTTGMVDMRYADAC
jgi:hypothetical protein